jgi:hypothetical protein
MPRLASLSDANATGLNISINTRNTVYGVNSVVSKNWGGSVLGGSAIAVYGSATTDSSIGSSYGGYFENLATAGTGYGVYINTTSGSGSVTPLSVNHASSELFKVTSGGNVGIGSTTPYAKLSVKGAGTGTGVNFQTTNSNNVPLFTGLDNGNVGIGTSSPSRTVEISGGAGEFDGLRITNTGNQGEDTVAIELLPASAANTTSAKILATASATNKVLSLVNVNSGTQYTALNLPVNAPTVLNNNPGGNAGTYGIDFQNSTGSNLQAYIHEVVGGGWPTQLQFGTAAGANNAVTQMTIDSNGNVGVGTTTPGAKFSINNSAADQANQPLFLLASSTLTSTTTVFQVSNTGIASTTGLIVSNAAGSTGCAQFNSIGQISNTGTACGTGVSTFSFTPGVFGATAVNATGTALQLKGGLFASSTVQFGNAGLAQFSFDSTTGNLGLGTTSPLARFEIVSTSTNSNLPLFTVKTSVAGATSTVLVIDSTGKLGIGTTTPGTPLSVNGAGVFTGTVTAPNFVATSTGAAFTTAGDFVTTTNGGGIYSSGNWLRLGVSGVTGSGVAANGSFLAMGQGTYIGFSTTADPISNQVGGSLGQDAINNFAFSNTTSAETVRVYNTRTDIANYERLTFDWNQTTNVARFGTENSGTGVARRLDFVTGSTTQMTISTSGNIGIGTTTPLARFEVVSTSSISTLPLMRLSTLINGATSTAFIVTASSTVGIGTSTPGTPLSVTGAGVFTGTVTAPIFSATSTTLSSNFPYASSTFFTTSNGLISAASTTIGNGLQGGGLTISGGATTTGTAYFAGNVGIGTSSPFATFSLLAGASSTNLTLFNISSSTNLSGLYSTTTLFTISNAGFVGIGTTTPGTPLSVTGAGLFTGLLTAPNFTATSTLATTTLQGTILAANGGLVGIGSTTPWGLLSVNPTQSIGAGPQFVIGSSSATSFVVTNAGRIGIGTTTPTSLVSIFAASTSQALNLFTISSTTNNFGTSTLFNISNTGSTTIGNFGACSGTNALTTNSFGTIVCGSTSAGGTFPFTPGLFGATAVNATSTALQLQGGLFASSTVQFGNGGLAQFYFDSTTGNLALGTTSPLARLDIVATSTNSTLPLFQTRTSINGATTTAFIITSTGNVGIGTTTPGTPLSVTGAAVFTGAVTAPIFNATSTTATSTFSGGLSVSNFAQTGTATSTFNNGITLTNGCFMVNGSCLSTTMSGTVLTAIRTYAATSTTVVTQYLWTKPASLSYAVVEIWGAGGGANSGAGGGGGFTRKTMLASSLPATGKVQLGCGGSNGSPTNGGTASDFAGLATSTGGGGGGFDDGAGGGYAGGNGSSVPTCGSTDNGGGAGGASGAAAGSHPGAGGAGVASDSSTLSFTGRTGSASYTGGDAPGGPGNFGMGGDADSNGGGGEVVIYEYTATNVAVGTISSGTGGQVAYYAADGTTVSGTSNLFISGSNVGVGSTTPWGGLSVNPNALGTGVPSFVVGSSTKTDFIIGNNGKVGIGSSSPSSLVSIFAASTTQALNLFTVGSTTGSSATSTFFNISNTGNITSLIGNGQDNMFSISTSTANQPIFSVSTRSSPAGLVGVGTSSPWGKLSVEMGPLPTSFVVSNSGSSTPAFFISGTGNNGKIGVGTSSPWALLSVDTTPLAGVSGPSFVIGSSTRTDFVVLQSGNVGVGSTTPGFLFTAAGSVSLGNGLNSTTTIASANIYYSVFSTTTIPVGINTWSLSSSTNSTSTSIISVNANVGTTTISFFGATSTLFAAGIGTSSSSNLRNYIIIGDGKLQAGMGIMNGGLCVDNDGWCAATSSGKISGRTMSTSGGSDIAEMYPSVEGNIQAGTIVASFGGPTIGTATSTMGNRIIGIISSQASLTIGDSTNGGDEFGGQVPVALAGRVPVRVNLEAGPIQVGDRITLSSTPGVGKKALGLEASVGIALETLPATSTQESTILAFVSLQNGIDQQSLAAAVASSTATTSLQALLASPFVAASTMLRDALTSAINAISTIASAGIKELGVAVHATVGIFDSVFAKTITAEAVNADTVHTDQLCVGTVCVTQAKFMQMVNGGQSSGSTSGNTATPPPPTITGTTTSSASGDTQAPVITLNGNNPATIDIGSTYVDLGALVTDNVDQNLGYQVSLDGGATMTVDHLSINTAEAATHTILYIATDQAGNIGSVTRTVHVVDPTPISSADSSSNTPDTNASSTPASTAPSTTP